MLELGGEPSVPSGSANLRSLGARGKAASCVERGPQIVKQGEGRMMIEITRRRAAVTLFGCLGMAGLGLLGSRRAAESAGVLGSLTRWLRSLPGAREVGAVYLRANPQDADPERLLASLAGESPATLLKRQRDDFRFGRTVTVRGWVLSRTEARLCALAALA